MEIVGVPWVQFGDNTSCYITASNEPEETEFLPGTQANVILKGKPVGTFGIVHKELGLEELDTESFL